MSEKKRVAFTFDGPGFNMLQNTTQSGGYSTAGEAIRDSLGTYNALQEQVSEGYSEVVVRNPETGAERVLIVPGLKRGEH